MTPDAAKFPEVPEHRGGSGLTPPARQMSAADEPLDGRAGDAGSNPAGASGRSAAKSRASADSGTAAKTFDVRLVAAAAHECVYVDGGQEPPCPEEWPGEPWKWCGACLAKAVTRDG